MYLCEFLSIFSYKTGETYLQLFLHRIAVCVSILLHQEVLEADADVLRLVFDITIVQLVAVSHQQILFSTIFKDSLKKSSFVVVSRDCQSSDLPTASSCNTVDNSLLDWSTRPLKDKEFQRSLFDRCCTAW